MKIENFKIESERLILRNLTKFDATITYLNWFKDPYILRFIEGAQGIHSTKNIENYIIEKNDLKDALLLGIFLKKNNQHIGNIKYEPLDLDRKFSVMGIMIGEAEYRGKGYGSEALFASIDWLKKCFKIKSIYLGVHVSNTQAIKSYKKVGFVVIDQIPGIETKKNIVYMLFEGKSNFQKFKK